MESYSLQGKSILEEGVQNLCRCGDLLKVFVWLYCGPKIPWAYPTYERVLLNWLENAITKAHNRCNELFSMSRPTSLQPTFTLSRKFWNSDQTRHGHGEIRLAHLLSYFTVGKIIKHRSMVISHRWKKNEVVLSSQRGSLCGNWW